jgi:predicted unusual protein kinase regulating ubiquinone biosynthesis (AarF/ABC1/UbiB family)
MSRRFERIATGWASRTGQAGRLALGLGRAAVRKALSSEDGDGAASDGAALLEHMDQMKGLAVKLGQMASYVDGALPDPAQRALRRLQSDAATLPYPVVRDAIVAELGAPPEQVFEAFEPEPFAAASLGQVHRARFDGRDVAVKVQYPGVADSIGVDLDNLDRLGLLARLGSGFRTRTVLAELRARFSDECDYTLEAANQRAFREAWAHDPAVVVPEVIAGASSRRVLTTTLQRGASLYDLVDAPAEARDRAGETLYRFAFSSIFGRAAFHADPHPGNYLFGADHVVFLDFGCVRYFPERVVAHWKAIARAMLAGDRAAFEEAFVDAGFVHGAKFDFDHQFEGMLYLYEPMRASGRYTFTPEYAKRSWDALLVGNPNLSKLEMPAEWVFANRLQWGLNSVLGTLGATARFGELFREALDQEVRPLRPALHAPES